MVVVAVVVTVEPPSAVGSLLAKTPHPPLKAEMVPAAAGHSDRSLSHPLISGQKRSLSMEVEMVEGVLSEVDHQLTTASQPQMIK